MRFCAAFAFVAALAASMSTAKAQSAVESGALDCRGRTTSYILASATELECLYTPAIGARPVPYSAQMHLIGVDVGFNQSVQMHWRVFAPTQKLGPGDLAGHYVGASANATVIVGVGANALFGGSNNTIALQPLGFQGQIGLSAAGGISSLDLVPLRPVHRGHRRHHRH
jgi:hypothetical protein